jgi:hypothetical protein
MKPTKNNPPLQIPRGKNSKEAKIYNVEALLKIVKY